MSNAKIRHWIYLAIGFLILCGGAWFLLLRDSKLTEDYLNNEILGSHSDDLQAVVSYLSAKGGENRYDLTGLPNIDNAYFGVPTEDSDEYRSYNSAVISLMRTTFDEIIYENGSLRFITPRSGGLLHSDYLILAYNETAPLISDAPQTPTEQKNWSYYLVTEKE